MNRDYEQFPDDDNGNILWQMVEDGDDLTELHEIEFSIAFQDQQNAEQCAMHLLYQEQKFLFSKMILLNRMNGSLLSLLRWSQSIQILLIWSSGFRQSLSNLMANMMDGAVWPMSLRKTKKMTCCSKV